MRVLRANKEALLTLIEVPRDLPPKLSRLHV